MTPPPDRDLEERIPLTREGDDPVSLELEFCTDMTRADAKIIWLATYLLDGKRWRRAIWYGPLTEAELSLCNLETWPELRDVDRVFGLVEPWIIERDGWKRCAWDSRSALRVRPVFAARDDTAEPNGTHHD